LDTTEREIARCSALGFKGVVFSQDPSAFGLPTLVDPHWDRLWSTAQEHGLSVNFHIGSAFPADFQAAMLRRTAGDLLDDAAARAAFDLAGSAATQFLANARTVEHLIMSGICHRYPELNFVSVESGAGYMRFVLELLDWHWINNGKAAHQPDRLRPSEY